MNTTEEVEFDYQAYMKEYTPDLGEIHRGPEAHQKRREAAIHNNRANAYAAKGDYNRAIEGYTKAIELQPDLAITYSNRGGTYRDKGDYDRAIEDCSTAIRLKPDYADAYTNRGAAHRSKGDYNRAIADYNMAIRLKPDFVEVYYNRGMAYGVKGDYDRAIEDYTMAIDLKPDFVEAHYNRGVAYYERREFARSIEDYSTAIDLRSEFAEAYYNRGEAWLHLREWKKAKSDLTNARSLGVNLITAFDYLYESVSDFEKSNSVKLPEDITAMLTPQIIAMQKEELQRQVVELVEQLSAGQLQAVIDYLTELQDQEGWEATHELAGDPEIAKGLERAAADVKAGRLKRWDDVRRDL